MKQFLEKMERKYGRYAVPHLTMVLIALWVVGYALEAISPVMEKMLSLNIYAILHGEVWRLVTWILIPPSDLDIWTIIMLLFYVSIGISLERVWGDFRYNVYILGGMILFIIAGFVTYFVFGIFDPQNRANIGYAIGVFFSTYYIAMTLMLAYAATFPNVTVYLMFVLPLKMKYLGIFYAFSMAMTAVENVAIVLQSKNALYLIPVIAIAVSLLNFLLFFMTMRNRVVLTKEQKQMRRQFRENMKAQQYRAATEPKERVVQGVRPRHRCEVCGRTDISNPELEFRYCTKCSGEHEYCMEHLQTHVHHEN